ncbi:MAG TPA: DUF2306 domain-containing protein [Terriglobia bacterium]|nr:DUF2306 domain-containing protein [Terriglobia bacterium]
MATSRIEATAWPEVKSAPLWIRAGFWLCILIAAAAVLRRIAVFELPNASSSRTAALDAVFASHEALTLVHIIPALAFVIIVPVVLFGWLPDARWPEPLLFRLGLVVSLTAYAMSAYPIGGWLEVSAVLVFNTLFLFSLIRAYLYKRRGDTPLKRRWLVRAIGILLGIATTRPIMGIFFATSPLTHLRPHQFFGIAFWLGFSINTLIVEIWLRTRPLGSKTPARAALSASQ